jgi:small subunit ribosomal protein S5
MIKMTKPKEIEEMKVLVDEEAPIVIKEGEWKPKTELGKRVASGEITDINFILDNGYVIMEKGILDALLPDLQNDLLLIGRAKGKFGGGKRRIFRQTQKKTKEGNKPKFATLAVVGNKQGIIGMGYGKSKETVPAREKAIRNARFNIFKIRRGCGSWECGCGEPHSLPFTIEGKCGSSIIRLIPAPKGTGLKVDKEIAKILELAGVTDVWSKTFGQSRTKINLIKATEAGLRKLMTTKLQDIHYQRLSAIDGPTKKEVAANMEKPAEGAEQKPETEKRYHKKAGEVAKDGKRKKDTKRK